MAAGQQREGGGMNRITEPTEEGLEVASAALTEAYGLRLEPLKAVKRGHRNAPGPRDPQPGRGGLPAR